MFVSFFRLTPGTWVRVQYKVGGKQAVKEFIGKVNLHFYPPGGLFFFKGGGGGGVGYGLSEICSYIRHVFCVDMQTRLPLR